MTHKLKVLLSISLILSMIFSTSIVFAASDNETSRIKPFESMDQEEINNQIEENISIIEQDLEMNNTSVEDELNKQISILEEEKNIANDSEEIENLRALIGTTKELLDAYIAYKNGDISNTETDQSAANSNSELITPMANHNTIYEPAISAIVSWFVSKGYPLSAELLTQARNNNELDSTYKPKYGTKAGATTVVKNIRKSSKTSGTDAFPNSGSSDDKDLYYAIHNFRWVKTSSNLVINDRYDFAPGDYDGIAGTAVNTMYLAQQAGAIVPFKIVINLPKN